MGKEKLIEIVFNSLCNHIHKSCKLAENIADDLIANDVVPVVRCQNCVHSQPLDRNCEINTSVYMHCGLLRGEETRNVWHKYKKYYKDYSLVERDDFCSYGERKDNERKTD